MTTWTLTILPPCEWLTANQRLFWVVRSTRSAQWRAAVGQLNFLVEEMIDAGDNVVVVARRQGRGEHSGLEISDRVIQVFHFEGDQCTSVHEYYDRDAALSFIRRDRAARAIEEPEAG